ncbi:MAG: hypothetical protein LBD06_01065 [Candidatus Accumulibacter sp.]|nr:hypothetical protein [Accumulibacter sp.]
MAKRLAALLTCFFCVAVAQAENPPVAPSADTRVLSLGAFNRMIDQLRPVSRYTLEAYVIAVEHPLCSSDGKCAPAFVLFSDMPPERVADERVTSLIRQFPMYEYNTRSMENMLNETRSDHAFLTLNAERTARLEAGKRYRLRIRATQDSWRYRTGFVVEDFSAALASATPAKNQRVYSVDNFNRLRATPALYTVDAHVVALAFPQCKPGGVCYPVFALLSDAPRERIANEKVETLIRQFYYEKSVEETEKALNETRSGHVFLALDLKFAQKSGELEPGTRYRLRIRVIRAPDHSRTLTGLVLEDFSPQTQ